MGDTRAKIVCTLGPASHDEATIRRMMEAGMNVARLNLSHGSHEFHRETMTMVRRAAKAAGRICGIMLDLQGPKVRVGRFAEGEALLEAGAAFTITSREVEGNARIVSTTHHGLPEDVGAGETVLLDDGLIVLRVSEVEGPEVRCEVVIGGVLKNNKGINIPGAALSVPTITEKDFEDAAFGVAEKVDFVAMSFVRHPDDIAGMRKYLATLPYQPPIIAKIEKPQALEHIDAIIDAADCIMVARGDLGVEMSPEEVPAIQKSLIAACNQRGKPVITATQMLESMVGNPRPTRAEASDVANAILDGSDAVMLSAESASGRYPVESVEVMHRIIQATENSIGQPDPSRRRRMADTPLAIHEGIAATACILADLVSAHGIASITMTGSMPRMIAKHRPSAPIYAVGHFEHVLRQLSLVWGIEGILVPDITTHIDQATVEVENRLESMGRVKKGDLLVLTAGLPFSERQATNMVRVDVVR